MRHSSELLFDPSGCVTAQMLLLISKRLPYQPRARIVRPCKLPVPSTRLRRKQSDTIETETTLTLPLSFSENDQARARAHNF